MRLVPLELSHLRAIRPAGAEGAAAALAQRAGALPDGVGFAALDETGRPIGAAGILAVAPGQAEGWAVLSDEIKARPHFLFRTVRRFLHGLERFGITRLEADVPDEPAARAWIEKLGFRPVGARTGPLTGRRHVRYTHGS